MFGLFKKKKKSIYEIAISEAILEFKKQGGKNLSIDLFIEDQILFQVMSARFFTEKGLKMNSLDDMAVVHFFNRSKSLTYDTWGKFQSEKMAGSFLNYEEPEGVFYYIKNIGGEPRKIQREIQSDLELYELESESKISIEYKGY